MIDETLLRNDLIRLLTATENNIRERCDESPAVNTPLQERYDAARRAGRTGMTFSEWREGEITQAGVAWLLACVFIRFLEDNDFLGAVYLAGPGERLKAAQDRRTVWYRTHPEGNDREYLLAIFSELEHLPGLKGLLDRAHNPLWTLGPDGDGAEVIWRFFQDANPDTQDLRHNFSDTAGSTRFLGDLYQNISESARKRYALLQTPDFIVDFILDRTLTPALKEFPLDGFRLIDPACGSGHFLLAAFDRLFPLWADRDGDLTVVVRNTLDCIYGVDLNPYAAAIARFRLLIAALRATHIPTLASAPDWPIHILAGDSLIFGPNRMVPSLVAQSSEDPEKLRVVLQAQGYQVVVANPPYINLKDAGLRNLYRKLYKTCSGSYQVSVPFTECALDLSETGGYVGMITSIAFTKQQFGRVLVEEFLPNWDLTTVIDTSGVYLPGHGTPTVILFLRRRRPLGPVLRMVRGIRGQIGVPDVPSKAPIWIEISNHSDVAGFEGQFVTVADVDREAIRSHPWSIGGGGAAELKERIGRGAISRVSTHAFAAGRTTHTGENEVFILPATCLNTFGLREYCVPLVRGEAVQEYCTHPETAAIFPYDHAGQVKPLPGPLLRRLWPYRTNLGNRRDYEQTVTERGLQWYEHSMFFPERFLAPLAIASGEIGTHPTFALERGGKLFNQNAPAILLRSPSLSTCLNLLSILNSSAVSFWLRQVCFQRSGDQVGTEGARVRKSLWDVYFSFNGTNLLDIPLPSAPPIDVATEVQVSADERTTLLPAALAARETPTRAALDAAHDRAQALLLRMIALQEELDWHVYHLYGLIDEPLTLPIDQVPPIQLGERAFEILMARAMAAGELETEWFGRHRSTPRTEIPEHWPAPYRALVQRRLETIAADRDIALIEQPEYKRRWNLPPWEELEKEALRNWLLNRLEDPRYWPVHPPALTSVARLADAVRLDPEFLQVAELYRGRPDFDVADLVQELVARESVPFLAVLRYKESGLRTRADWEQTWALQRREDAGETVEIPVPPKYERTDFLSADYWRLRGKLDVPKERWISYPHLERDADKSLVIAWAGYDHGQQALALAGYANDVRANDGWTADRLVPVFAGLEQLQPWLDQWHNEIDPDRQQRLNESIRTFVESEMTQLGISSQTLRDWRPPARGRAGRPRKTGARATIVEETPQPPE